MIRRLVGGSIVFVLAASVSLHGQVTAERLLNTAREARNWMIYSGGYFSNRHSALTQITPANARNLELKWMYQAAVAGAWQTTPLVVDGVMYLTQRPNDVVALDAKTGRVFWMYRHQLDPTQIVCCGANNRGLAILGDTLFMGTLDARLVAIDAKVGRPLWTTQVADNKAGYSVTLAPLVVKDKVIIGVGGGEYGIRGFIAAYDAKSGKEAWRFDTIPGPGEAGFETWQPCAPSATAFCDSEAWKHGGGSVWVTGSVRSGAEPDLLGRWQRWSGLERGSASRRQPLHRFGGGARRRHRPSAVALPIHAARSLRLRLGAGAGAGRYHVSRSTVEGDGLGKPERQLLSTRSRNRQIPGRQTIRQSELDGHVRRAWPAPSDRAAAGPANLAGKPGRHELVFTFVQPAHRTLLHSRVGRLRDDFRRHCGRVSGGTEFWRRRESIVRARARCAGGTQSAAGTRSTIGPTRLPAARCWRSMPPLASRNGNFR